MEGKKFVLDFEEQVGFRKSGSRIKVIPSGQCAENKVP